MTTIRREIPQEQQRKFIDCLFSPDLTEGIFYVLYTPVIIPDGQDIYKKLNSHISGIFLERGFSMDLEYSFVNCLFIFQVTMNNKEREQELTRTLEHFIDKAIEKVGN
ncbi:MAG: hypothetical protein HGB26_05550 [Desulfobulbaceae bacterium]|nr:hypothetical protein [Desulfobulbaceae bacterium]